MKRTVPLALLALLLVGGASCAGCNPPPIPGGDVCGAGTVDGSPFSVDPARTRFLLGVKREDGGTCSIFHSHAVNATVALGEFTIDSANAGASTFTLEVAAAGLEPDDPALRRELFGDGPEGDPISDGDRQSIRGSVAEEVVANENPTLTFVISNLSTTQPGEGTATLTSTIAGATSEIELAYTLAKEGDAHVITGTGVLLGTPHGIPRNALGFCINPNMDVKFELALVPGATECEGAPPPPPFEPTTFPDDGCAETTGYADVRDVVVRRCAGCHADVQQLGASAPLVDFLDWRVDSVRNQGRPLFETASDFIHLDPTQGLAMPPQPLEGDLFATDLTPEEEAIFDTWVTEGAHEARCNGGDPAPFDIGPRVDQAACDDANNYTTVNVDGASPQLFFETYCAYCHLDGSVPPFYIGVPQIAEAGAAPDPATGYLPVDFEIAAASINHPFYAAEGVPASFWQASPSRIEDLSMPPGTPPGIVDDPGYQVFLDWVNAGSPAPCP